MRQVAIFLACSIFIASCGGGGSATETDTTTETEPATSSASAPAATASAPVASAYPTVLGAPLSTADKAAFLYVWWYRSPLNEPGCFPSYGYNTSYYYKEGSMTLGENTMAIETSLYNDPSCKSYAGSISENYNIAWAQSARIDAPFFVPIARIATRYTGFTLDTAYGTGVYLAQTPNGSVGMKGRDKMTLQAAVHEGTSHPALYLPIDGSAVDQEGYPITLEKGELHRHRLIDGCC
jgi:hypothetical protein